jgi:type I restriction enzyme R subunit
MSKTPPEIAFQNHVAAELLRRFRHDTLPYTQLEQSDITDTDNFIAEDVLWAFITASQPEAVEKVRENYGDDTRDEFFKALRSELCRRPLWLAMRDGIEARGVMFRLYFAHPRSAGSESWNGYRQNRFSFRHHFYFGDTNKEIDFVFFLNGLPIVTLELKHEKNQTVHDAVLQYVGRDHTKKIFQHPFAYIAADTSDVMLATDPSREKNFRWHNKGLVNEPATAGEYPVEHLYAEVLAPENLLEDIAFFLVRSPEKPATGKEAARPAFTIYPRWHQSRTVKNIAADITAHFAATGDVGRKYLASHAPGSGKTLTICWLAARLESLYKPGTDEKLFDTVFIVTAAKSLDTNIKDDIVKFTHIKDKVGLSAKSEDVDDFLHGNLEKKVTQRQIIVTTQQKLAWILDRLMADETLKDRRVAFLIDEAHRDQEGKRAANVKKPFTKDGMEEDDDPEEENAEIIRAKAGNQMFIAFTATPSQATVDLFGKPFDTYSEAEAIQEGYIVDVASSIVSYKTLYNLHCSYVPPPGDEKEFPKGLVAKALKNIAYGDFGIVQYKAEVMLRHFQSEVMPLIGGRAKAMIVAPSRPTGLLYYRIIADKLRQRGAGYKALFAFADFTHPETNEVITEHQVNGLADGEKIEDRFDTDEYRLMIVANKFQTGFNQPLLAGMFIDKPIVDRNAVQTVSRLNRKCDGKDRVVVVDFTNNADAILKAFAKYREGTPFTPDPPDPERAKALFDEILGKGVFSKGEIDNFAALVKSGASDAVVQYNVAALRTQFLGRVPAPEERKAYVLMLARYVRQIDFFRREYQFGEDMMNLYVFADVAGRQLIKQGTMSELMYAMRHTQVTKASVQFNGVKSGAGVTALKPSRKGGGLGSPPAKTTVQDMIREIAAKFKISDEEALFIREVTEQKIQDPEVKDVVDQNKADSDYLFGTYRRQVHEQISDIYQQNGKYAEAGDEKYTADGGIFDSMATIVIQVVRAA